MLWKCLPTYIPTYLPKKNGYKSTFSLVLNMVGISVVFCSV